MDRSVVLSGRTAIDLGPRDLVVAAGGAIDAGTGDLRLTAHSLRITPRGALFARGGRLTIVVGGDVDIQRSADGAVAGRIVVASGDGGGDVEVAAGGSILIAGVVNARGTAPSADGGSIALDAGGDVTVTAASDDVTVGGGLQASGGTLELMSRGGAVTVQHRLDASGGDYDGGEIDVTARGDVVLDALDVSGGGASGSGGTVTIAAGGDATLAGIVNGAGAGDGTGAEVSIAAEGSVRVAAPIRVPGALPDGTGGCLDITATGDVVVGAPLQLQALGAAGCGGDASVVAGGSVGLLARIDVSGGADCRAGSIDAQAAGDLIVAAEVAADGDLGTVRLSGGRVVLPAGAAVHAEASPLGLGSEVGLFGHCDVEVAAGARVASGGRDGDTVLASGGLIVVAGVLVAGQENRLRYGNSTLPPRVTGVVTPAATLLLDATAPACGSPLTSTTTTSSSSTTTSTALTPPASTTTSTTLALPSDSTTTTVTVPPATPPPTLPALPPTTSTTPRPEGCTTDCDDGDPCTFDACRAGTCTHDDAPGTAAVVCRLDAMQTALETASATTVRRAAMARHLRGRLSAVARVLDAAPGAGRLRRAQHGLGAFDRVVARAAGRALDGGLAARLLHFADAARVRLVALRVQSRSVSSGSGREPALGGWNPGAGSDSVR